MIIKRIIKAVLKKRNEQVFTNYVVHINDHGNAFSKKVVRYCKKRGFSIDDYYCYQLDRNDYKLYIPTIDSYLPRMVNDAQMMVVSDNKIVFPFFMKNYFHVADNIAYIDANGIIRNLINSEKDLIDMLKTGSFICKPYNGHDGMGIKTISYDGEFFIINGEKIDCNSLLNHLSSLKCYVVQEAIIPHRYSYDIYPNSLNTIRVISCFNSKTGLHEIVCAVHRFGTHKSFPADNFSKGGISALIDVETGKIGKATSWYLVDDNGDRLFLANHPDTNSAIEGVSVPCWDEIKTQIVNFSKKIGFYKFIAWDFAIDRDGVAYVVETNMKSSLGVFQIHRGMVGTKLNKVLEEYKNEKK